jgi:hypothetical protein
MIVINFKSINMLEKIVSGGQTGAGLAALYPYRFNFRGCC